MLIGIDIADNASPLARASSFTPVSAPVRARADHLLTSLLDMAESAGWKRRTAASTLMFLAAQHVSAAASET